MNMPESISAEVAVLGICFLDQNAVADVCDALVGADFYLPSHQMVYDAIREVWENGEHVTPIEVAERLKSRGRLAEAGGVAGIVKLSEGIPFGMRTEPYFKAIRKARKLRDAIRAAADFAAEAQNEKIPNEDEAILNLEKLLCDIRETHQTQGAVGFAELILTEMASAERRCETGEVPGISTGFYDLDRLTGGLQAKDFIVLGARPSMGKTSLALSIARNVADQGKRVLIASIEMGAEALARRLITSEAMIDSQTFAGGRMLPPHVVAARESARHLATLPITINDRANKAVELRAACQAMARTGGVDLIVVDYLQLMRSESRVQNRVQEVSQFAAELKGIAKTFNAPVLALSQLSRACEARTPPKPVLSDLRDSGAIEQDADQVWFLYRDEYYMPTDDNAGTAELNVAKNRNGATGRVTLGFKKSSTRFVNLSRERI